MVCKSKLIIKLKHVSEISPSENALFQTSYYDFEEKALEIFRFQYKQNNIYRSFVDHLKIDPETINTLQTIPFLPISFFKTHDIKTTAFDPEVVFESSGTTQKDTSRHYVKKWKLYEKSFLACFELFYGNPADYCIVGLLPGYLERQNSSLVAMVDILIRQSRNAHSGFYLDEFEKLFRLLVHNEFRGVKTIVIGVTFALLDFAEQYEIKLNHTIIMETGGMKGRRKEITRAEVHEIIRNKTGVQSVHSEYGMTELLSQAYSLGKGIFHCPPWMRVLIGDINDPLGIVTPGEKHASGLIKVIDLANIYSCSFIATEDIGRLNRNGTFEVMGRTDTSLVRGCNLLVM